MRKVMYQSYKYIIHVNYLFKLLLLVEGQEAVFVNLDVKVVSCTFTNMYVCPVCELI